MKENILNLNLLLENISKYLLKLNHYKIIFLVLSTLNLIYIFSKLDSQLQIAFAKIALNILLFLTLKSLKFKFNFLFLNDKGCSSLFLLFYFTLIFLASFFEFLDFLLSKISILAFTVFLLIYSNNYNAGRNENTKNLNLILSFVFLINIVDYSLMNFSLSLKILLLISFTRISYLNNELNLNENYYSKIINMLVELNDLGVIELSNDFNIVNFNGKIKSLKFEMGIALTSKNNSKSDINKFCDNSYDTNELLNKLFSCLVEEENNCDNIFNSDISKIGINNMQRLLINMSKEKLSFIGTSLLDLENNLIKKFKIYAYFVKDKFVIVVNDITQSMLFDNEKWYLKSKCLFLAKFMHDFKNPLITLTTLCNINLPPTEDNCQSDSSSDDEELKNNNLVKRASCFQTSPYNNIVSNSNMLILTSISNYLLVMIEDLNTFTKMQDPVLKNNEIVCLNEVDIEQIVQFCIEIFKIRLNNDNKNLTISYQNFIPNYIKVLGNEQKLKQIIINLISNSYKFTLSGYIKVEIMLIHNNEQGIDKIRISVLDSGLGLSEQEQKELFKPFSQIERNQKYNAGGSGLGLSIVKELLYQIGCSLFYSSQKDKGSIFWFDCQFVIHSSKLKNKSFSLASEHGASTLILENHIIYNESLKNMIQHLNKKLKSGELIEIMSHNNESFNIIVENDEDCTPRDRLNTNNTYFNNDLILQESVKLQHSNVKKVNNIVKKISNTSFRRFSNSSKANSIISQGGFYNNIQGNIHNMNNFNNASILNLINLSSYKDSLNNSNVNRSFVRSMKSSKTSKGSLINWNCFVNSNDSQYIRSRRRSITSTISKNLIIDNNLCDNKEDLSSTSIIKNIVNIIICDDDRIVRITQEMLISKIAEKLKMHVNIISFDNGAECLYFLYKEFQIKNYYNILFIDECMPFVCGSSVIRLIKEAMVNRQLNDIYIYSVTSYVDITIKEILLASGCNEVLEKPINKHVLKNILEGFKV